MEGLSGNDQPTGRDFTMNLKRPPRKEHLFFPFGESISDLLGHQCGFILDDLAIWILLFCFAISNLCQQTEEKNPQKQTSGTNVEAVFDRLKRKKSVFINIFVTASHLNQSIVQNLF